MLPTRIRPSEAWTLLVFLLLSVLASAPFAVAQDTPTLWSGLEPGPHAVGFDVRYIVDDARSITPPGKDNTGGQGRPIRIMLWYPVSESAAHERMVFGDYIRVAPREPRFTAYNDTLVQRDLSTARRQFAGASSDSLYRVLLATPTMAHRGAPPKEGPFPLVLHSLGRNDYQQESTVLWEYLASHGYVVATVPQFGPDLARHGLSFTLEDLGIQQRDVSFALSHVRRLPYVDARHVGVVGHSSGGVVGLLLASENTSVAALVSLDGSITTEDGRDLLAQASWDPRSMRAPVLNVYAAEKRGLTFSVLDSLVRADRYHVTVDRATHFDFQNWPLYAVLTGVPDPRGESVRPSEHGRDVYVAAARLTRHFFDAVLKGDDRVLKALKAEEVPSFVPDGLVQVQYTGSGSH